VATSSSGKFVPDGAYGQVQGHTVFTTLLRDGNLFYCIAVAPQGEYQAYQRSFQRVAQSIRLSD
jgi:hypothetical protein